MKILITGANGYLAGSLYKYLSRHRNDSQIILCGRSASCHYATLGVNTKYIKINWNSEHEIKQLHS